MIQKQRGISLIVLIITIIVLIILASVVVLSINNDNPVDMANEARFKSDLKSFTDVLIDNHFNSSTMNQNYAREDVNISAGNYTEIKKYIPDITQEYANKLLIKNGELLYIGDDLDVNFEKYYNDEEEKWAEEIGVSSPYSKVGDANGDGKVNEDDVKKITNDCADNIDFSLISERIKRAYDVDKNGTINVEDTIVLTKYLNGEINKL